MNMTSGNLSPEAVHDISQRAYFIYVNSGEGHGHDLEHWFEAERERSIDMSRLGPSPYV